MINIQTKTNCCGCSACANRCPVHCITMIEDNEGFLYPHVEPANCINCGLCEKVCPLLHKPPQHDILTVIGCKNKDESVRMLSSSGGTFSLLAEQILQKGGIVFGAAFDQNWQVQHIAVTNTSNLNKLRGSKYVQSDIGTTYQETEKFLTQGHTVLFSGTPCQISGLKQFLGKQYEHLYTVDLVCHGVPSPKVYRKRLAEVVASAKEPVTKVNFRDKTPGWKKFNIIFATKHHTFATHKRRGPFMRLFLNNVSTRPCCSECAFNNKRSLADLTIADYWGVHKHFPHFDDDKGVTLVLVNTIKGSDIFTAIQPSTDCQPTDFTKGAEYNIALTKSLVSHPRRSEFFTLLENKSLSNWADELLGIAEE